MNRRIFLAVLTAATLLPYLAGAEPLTPAQLTALKNDIAADGTLGQLAHTPDNAFAIAVAYNANASPDFWVWRSRVPESEVYSTTTEDATTWSWSAYIARSQGERDGWTRMFSVGGAIDASKANVRQGIADIFSGNTNSAPAQRTHLLTLARRRATRAEKLFAAGTGTTASPATMAWEGSLNYQDVLNAWNS